MLNRDGAAFTWLTLLTSSSTLVCCALPALLVSLGAGASLASLVTLFPQLIWISKHKALVFGLSAAMLLVAGFFQVQPASCPADRRLAAACARQKTISRAVYGIAVLAYLTGAFFAFVLPKLL